jgi:di/tricarboxylate transporter
LFRQGKSPSRDRLWSRLVLKQVHGFPLTDIWIVFAIIGGVIVLFIWDRLPVIIVCVGAAVSLWATGVLTLNQSLAGFGDPATVFVASLFVVSAGLERTGLTAWVGQILVGLAGDSRARLLVLMMVFVALLSALISVNGAVAALLPVVIVMAIRLGRSPSQLLMPLVFGAHAGSMLALTGTPVNVLVMEASYNAGAGGFSYFEYALVGVPLVIGCVAIAVLAGARLLPLRESANLPPDLSRHAATLVEQFRLTSDLHQFRVRPDSRLAGSSRKTLDLSDRPGLGLVTVKASDGVGGAPRTTIEAGDIIVVRGDAEAAAALATECALSPREDDGGGLADALLNRSSGLAEVVVPPRSPLVGQRLFPGMVTESGDLIVLAVQRQGEDIPPGAALSVGDTMLLQGTWRALDRRLNTAEVLVVNSPDLVRRQAVPMGEGAKLMLAILIAMVVLLATGAVPAAVAGLGAAGAVLLSGILSVEQVYRSISWTTVILIAGMMPLSTAIIETGAAEMLADRLVAALGDGEPRLLLVGLFLLTAVFSQVISNTATALIIIPIAVVAAQQMGVSPQPVLMCVAVAAAGAFLTPVATPTNLMVMEPAGYRFGDYWKFGLPMMVWFFVLSVFYVPMVWPL